MLATSGHAFGEASAGAVSPITGDTNIELVKEVSVKKIVQGWKQMGYDVTYLFHGIEKIQLYKCRATGYQFYNPPVLGDSALYSFLQGKDWYYMPWKWEHEIATEYLCDGLNVLEIGCGRGGFLEGIVSRYKLFAAGLELNKEAVKLCRAKGLMVYEEQLEEHSDKNAKHYDIVCCFQVLEHISEVKNFLLAGLKCLKSHGYFVVSVPNNDSFGGETFGVLNAPPHHQGLWDRRSLCAVAAELGLDVKALWLEPLQPYHIGCVQSLVEHYLTGGSKFGKGVIRLLGMKRLINKLVCYLSKWMVGHTIMAIYQLKR
jgi:2-polyprenyl-3-methyl-5-hydroxy-6-metoxy-1,4-benzoquinol methylase